MPGHDGSASPIRVAAVGDLHCGADARGAFGPLFARIAESADVLALCGDLTNFGLPDEARALARELSAVKLPIVAVLGNHDHESGQAAEVHRILADAGVTFLDSPSGPGGVELRSVGFAGAKGFAGGFGRGTLSAFGEATVKRFVQESLDEALRLETALQRLRTPHRIAVLHYAPVRATVEGEPPEIYPFLGCSRLEEPLNRLQVTACVHGHAHRGALEGRTSAGVPVYNVSLPLLRAHHPDRPPFRLLELPAAPPPAPGTQASPALGTEPAEPSRSPVGQG